MGKEQPTKHSLNPESQRPLRPQEPLGQGTEPEQLHPPPDQLLFDIPVPDEMLEEIERIRLIEEEEREVEEIMRRFEEAGVEPWWPTEVRLDEPPPSG